MSLLERQEPVDGNLQDGWSLLNLDMFGNDRTRILKTWVNQIEKNNITFTKNGHRENNRPLTQLTARRFINVDSVISCQSMILNVSRKKDIKVSYFNKIGNLKIPVFVDGESYNNTDRYLLCPTNFCDQMFSRLFHSMNINDSIRHDILKRILDLCPQLERKIRYNQLHTAPNMRDQTNRFDFTLHIHIDEIVNAIERLQQDAVITITQPYQELFLHIFAVTAAFESRRKIGPFENEKLEKNSDVLIKHLGWLSGVYKTSPSVNVYRGFRPSITLYREVLKKYPRLPFDLMSIQGDYEIVHGRENWKVAKENFIDLGDLFDHEISHEVRTVQEEFEKNKKKSIGFMYRLRLGFGIIKSPYDMWCGKSNYPTVSVPVDIEIKELTLNFLRARLG